MLNAYNPLEPLNFRYYCQKVLPAVYDDSLSYYELLCKIVSKVNEIINTDNIQNEGIKKLTDYVNHYFDNLDVQQQINTKLDAMAQSGELSSIIAQFLTTINIFGFKTQSDLKAAAHLAAGTYARTMGSTAYTDGHGAYYYIRAKTPEDVPDDDNIIALTNFVNLVAEKIPDATLDDITTRVTTLETTVTAIDDKVKAPTGNLSDLLTPAANLVYGINQNTTGLTSLQTTTTAGFNTVNQNIGDISNLATTDKSSLVGAINEVKTDKIPITRGGTNAISVSGARANLGVLTQYVLFDSQDQPNQLPTNGNIDFEIRLMDLGLDLKDFKFLEFYYSNQGEGTNDDGMHCTRVYPWGSDGRLYFDNTIALCTQGSTLTDKLYFNIAHTLYAIGTPEHDSQAIRINTNGKTATVQITRQETAGDPIFTYSANTGADIWVYRVVGYI